MDIIMRSFIHGKGFGTKGMGVLYSFLKITDELPWNGSMVQANSAISTMEYTWHVPTLAGGLIFTGLLVLVTWGESAESEMWLKAGACGVRNLHRIFHDCDSFLSGTDTGALEQWHPWCVRFPS